MGDSSLLRPDDVVAFIDAAEQDVAEVNRPNPIVDFLEAHGMLLQGVGEKEQPLLQANGARVGDTLDEKVAGVFDRRQRARVGPRGGVVQRGRRPIAQGLVGPFIIVETAEGIEGALLGGQARLRRPTRLPLERLVHALVGAVLLRVGGQNPLVLDAESQPPDVQLREAVNAGGGEGHAVIGANRAGQAILAKESIEDGAYAPSSGGEPAVARQEIAGVLVGDRQRVAVDRVPRAKWPLKSAVQRSLGWWSGPGRPRDVATAADGDVS
jgi:hypothetical protein